MSRILASVAVTAAIVVGTGSVAVAATPGGRRDIATHVIHPDGRRDGPKPAGRKAGPDPIKWKGRKAGPVPDGRRDGPKPAPGHGRKA